MIGGLSIPRRAKGQISRGSATKTTSRYRALCWNVPARHRRFTPLTEQVRALAPDVVFVREVNPAGRYACHLLAALGMVEINQVVNISLTLGPVGLPANRKVGLELLAPISLERIWHNPQAEKITLRPLAGEGPSRLNWSHS